MAWSLCSPGPVGFDLAKLLAPSLADLTHYASLPQWLARMHSHLADISPPWVASAYPVQSLVEDVAMAAVLLLVGIVAAIGPAIAQSEQDASPVGELLAVWYPRVSCCLRSVAAHQVIARLVEDAR